MGISATAAAVSGVKVRFSSSLIVVAHNDINTIFSNNLMEDVLNIKRGNKMATNVDGIIEIETKYENNKRVTLSDDYYIKLSSSPNNLPNKQNIELDVPEFEVPEENVSEDNSIQEEIVLDESGAEVDSYTNIESTSNTNTGTTVKPEVNTDTNTGTTVKPEVNTDTNTGTTVKPEVNTDTNIGTTVKPEVNTDTNTGTTVKPEVNPSVPPVSNEPSFSIESSNILPENKFSSVMPEMKYGNLDSMEIGKSMVNYSVNNISESNYNDYVKLLENSGYTYSEGKWLKDNYELVLDYSNDNLNISLLVK